MMQNNLHIVVGLGATGFSCVKYLVSKNIPVTVVDTRENPPHLADCQTQYPHVKIQLGAFQADLFESANTVVISPGVSLEEPCIQRCIKKNIPVIGDVEIFARDATAPIIAITGSNGKSTLTTLMGELIQHAGYQAIVCGNIGFPVLDALMQSTPDYFVVELSSFQLDTTYSLKAKVAVVINVSPDHMDRYPTVDAYCASKQRIYHHCEYAVINKDEPDIWKTLSFKNLPIAFTLQKPGKNEWGLSDQYLAYGEKKIIAVTDLVLQERHNHQNFLAALAIGSALQLPLDNMVQTLMHFSGLPHRCQWVDTIHQVAWYNDSKATNVGAAIAAIQSMRHRTKGKMILLAGGDSKGVDLTPLQNPVKKNVAHVILFGKDAPLLQDTLKHCAVISRVNHLREAVHMASQLAQPGDVVLLSPACASLDQYENYAARGRDFEEAVKLITH